MCERKYQYYNVVIKFADGNVENIESLNEVDVDKTNHKEMLKVYNETKEQYKDKECTIEFVGTNDSSSMSVMFYKEIKPQHNGISENEDNVINSAVSLNESLSELIKISTNLKKRRKYLNDMQGFVDKQQDFLLHKIENCEDSNLDSISYELIKELKDIRISRRNIKNENKTINNLYNLGLFGAVDKVIKIIQYEKDKNEIKLEEVVEKAINTYSSTLMENELIKEVNFENHKQRINLMKQLQPKYNKLVVDDERRKILCYNKCKG